MSSSARAPVGCGNSRDCRCRRTTAQARCAGAWTSCPRCGWRCATNGSASGRSPASWCRACARRTKAASIRPTHRARCCSTPRSWTGRRRCSRPSASRPPSCRVASAPLHDFGTISVDATRRAPLLACSGDQSAAIFAFGPPSTTTAYVNAGTGAFVQRVLRDGAGPAPRGLLKSVLFARTDDAAGALYCHEGTINGAYAALEWLGKRCRRRRQAHARIRCRHRSPAVTCRSCS